jgi:hypothetical protein
MSRNRDRGTWAETASVDYFQHSGFPQADRLTLKGNKDRGDVGLCPGVIAEVKNCKSMDIAGWLRETEVERGHAGAAFAFLLVKPPGIGKTRVNLWWSVMYQGQWDDLRSAAGRPRGHAVTISGAAYKKLLPPLLKSPDTSAVVIRANGVKNERDWYVVTRLEQQVSLLRAAGYGSPEVFGAGLVG